MVFAESGRNTTCTYVDPGQYSSGGPEPASRYETELVFQVLLVLRVDHHVQAKLKDKLRWLQFGLKPVRCDT